MSPSGMVGIREGCREEVAFRLDLESGHQRVAAWSEVAGCCNLEGFHWIRGQPGKKMKKNDNPHGRATSCLKTVQGPMPYPWARGNQASTGMGPWGWMGRSHK